MPIVPSVAMKGSILPTVVIRPLARPQSEPMTMASAMAAAIIRPGSAIAPEFMNRIIRLATKATIDPTERSRSPDEMTKVAPTAMIAMKAERVATLARLLSPMKLGFTRAPTISRISSAAKGATARRSTSRQIRRPRPGVVVSVSAVIVFPSPPARPRRRWQRRPYVCFKPGLFAGHHSLISSPSAA